MERDAGSVDRRGDLEADAEAGRRLDRLVTWVASRLMPVRRDEADEAVAGVLQQLRHFFDVDTVFLRRNDHERGASVLVDEWPRRPSPPHPDPLGEVAFDADPVFLASRDLRDAFVLRPRSSNDEYQERIRRGSGVPFVSMAMVPLMGRETDGVLGLVSFADRAWSAEETGALQAIASMLLQLWGRLAAEDELHHQATHDALTGLGNRRALFEELDRRRAAPGRQVAVVFVDLDNHKDVNDVLGHEVGDRLLITIGERVRSMIREEDFPARIGGDEFVVLLDGVADEGEAQAAAERMVALIAQPVTIQGHELRRTVSAGVVLARNPETSADELVGQADTALYRAKELGSNQAVVFDESLRVAAQERFSTEALLRRGLREGTFELYYQPELDLASGRLLAVEALLRWHHPYRGLLGADAFIEVAESSRIVLELGEWVLEEAARQAAEWAERFPELKIDMRVNVSPLQLRNPGLTRVVASCLEGRPLEGRLTLEITEHAVMHDVEQARHVLAELRGLGVTVALDDFGTGYSSLAQLRRLPLDFLKIDRAFVTSLGTVPTDRAVLDAIMRLGAAYDLELIAEGVESRAHIEHLLAVGCRRAQGYGLARPLPAQALEPTLVAGGVDARSFAPSA
ncbi:EAL domain-containing protein [Egibacter rhizosphaerae]|uniref:EAL domain-containing protein n=1 Tax=Egibacter rhizosphaerae TaxID=1670831 RepID=A0A411YER8_9ACTN|nr:EAL domain-containing protein [Egibacter rhizosphaerae]QBI19699.1 EAL domain-containing protein [Egibacter rhizosphaerae]